MLLADSATSKCKESSAEGELPKHVTPAINKVNAVQAGDRIGGETPSFAKSSTSKEDSKCAFPEVEDAKS